MLRPLTLSLLIAYSSQCFSYDWIPERRKDQNPTQPAHLVVPLPYSKPGIGDGLVLMGTVSNVAETTADITGLFVTGDADGSIINGSEVPLFSDVLFLDFFVQNINRAAISNYSIRGISNTSEDDFTVLDLSVADELNAEINLTFFDRRLNFYYSYRDFEYQVDAIRNHDGTLIAALGEPYTNSESSDSFRISIDLTDDYLDPRTGIRFDLAYQDHDAVSINDPDFYTLNYMILGYIPMGKIDTLVLNYYQSDARVQRQGNTDPASIRAELDMNCAPADTQCLTAEQELVDNFINARTNGTSVSLGGDL
ncbi:MAG: hypothetical protein OQK32_02290, partial [Gammaproteobacteria bacterium]|nr:hypothetical protein [Gammaproteobacteria bacterium]